MDFFLSFKTKTGSDLTLKSTEYRSEKKTQIRWGPHPAENS